MGSIDISVRKRVRVAKAQIDVGLRCKVEYSIDTVLLQAVHHLVRVRDVAMVEGEVPLAVEDPCVVQGRTVVQLVEGDDIVCIGVG